MSSHSRMEEIERERERSRKNRNQPSWWRNIVKNRRQQWREMAGRDSPSLDDLSHRLALP